MAQKVVKKTQNKDEVKKPKKVETPEKEIEEVKEEKQELKVPESFFPVPEDPIEEPISPKKKKSRKDKKKKDKKLNKHGRVKLKYRTKENDIRYQGPLSYRYLRILGWLFMAVAQLGIVFGLASALDIQGVMNFERASSIVSFFAAMPLAFFMLANFGIILRNRHNFKYLFVFYGGVMLALYVVANLVVIHYVYGSIRTLDPTVSFNNVALDAGTFLAGIGTSGYIFNLFVDLFLCVMIVFFFFYNPRHKFFEGKKIIIFRLLVLIPIAYEILSIVIKQAALLEQIRIPSYFFFLLTSKPPLTFAAFFIVTLILKIREMKFLREYNHDEALLMEHNNTNAHSFRTSITISIVFTIIAVIDLLALIVYVVITFIRLGVDDNNLFIAMSMGSQIGFGESASLFFISPLVLLYSYTRTHKNKKFDSFLPFFGIAFMLFTIIEGCFITLRIMLPQLMDSLFAAMADEAEAAEGADPEVFEVIRNSALLLFRGYK